MIRHVVMINFKTEIGEKERDEFCKKSAETLAQIPGTHNVFIGKAAEMDKARYSFSLFIDFDDEATLKTYVDHPLHQGVRAKLVSMITDSFVSNYRY